MPELNTHSMDELIVYDETEGVIAKLAENYKNLEVKSLEDRQAFLAVRAARIDVKNRRVKVEARRKELKAGALEYGRKVDARAKELTGLLLAIETPLKDNEDWYQAEKDRLKREEEAAKAAALQARVDALAAVGGSLPVMVVGAMTDEEYQEALAAATTKWKAEQARLQEERRQQEEERARLEALRAEQEAEAQRLREEREALEAEKRAQEARERAEVERQEREAREARLAQEAAERAAQEERERIAREEAERKLAAARAAEEEARQEALRPDQEKLRSYATELLDVPMPVLTMPEAQVLLDAARKSLLRVTTALTKGAEGL